MRNALRHLDLPFEELVIEARKVEEESKGATRLAGVHAQPAESATTTKESANEKLDFLSEHLATLEAKVNELGKKTTKSAGIHGTAAEYDPDHPQAPKCSKCQKPGHFTFGCRSHLNITCYKGGTKGHVAASCLKVIAPQK